MGQEKENGPENSDPQRYVPPPQPEEPIEKTNVATPRTAHENDESPPRLGNYRLLQKIGEGGQGSVWMADQLRPIQRRVAIKLLKPGHIDKHTLARFDAEQHALERMHHSSIAQVLDAGTTADGRPFIVMELVHGKPLTKFCDDNKLDVKERLRLFIRVCRAVEHAHQKGVIHRDLKPGNVLVAHDDGKPIPKVIDFGLAKAKESFPKLTEQTMFTRFGMVMGTIQYMSPEQLDSNPLDLDTRTDIYSLGVVLYELLTGSTPIDAESLKERAIDEVFRSIREEEPAIPSAKLGKSTESLPVLSTNRRSDPQRLPRSVQGDLDAITMKALEKSPSRRFPTADAFAHELELFLDGRPISIRSPSISYLIAKSVRKHRAAYLVGVAFALLILAGFAATGWQAYRATIAERDAMQKSERIQALLDAEMDLRLAAEASEKDAKEVAKFLSLVLRSPNPEFQSPNITVAEMLDEALKRIQETPLPPLREAFLLDAIGMAYLGLHRISDAIKLLEKSYNIRIREQADDLELIRSANNLAAAHAQGGSLKGSAEMLTDVINRYERMTDPPKEKFCSSLLNLSNCLRGQGKPAEAFAFAQRAHKLNPTLQSLNEISEVQFALGHEDDAFETVQEAIKLWRKTPDDTSQSSYACLVNFANVSMSKGLANESTKMLEDAFPKMQQRIGKRHPIVLMATVILTRAKARTGHISQRDAWLKKGMAIVNELTDPRQFTSTSLLKAVRNFVAVNRDYGNVKKSAEILQRLLGEIDKSHAARPELLRELANTELKQDNIELAQSHLLEAWELLKVQRGPGDHETLAILNQLSLSFDDFAKAEPFFRLQQKGYETHHPDHWKAFDAKFKLGFVIIKNRRRNEGAPLMVAGVEGLIERIDEIPDDYHAEVAGAVSLLVQFYQLDGNAKEATKWLEIKNKHFGRDKAN